MYYTYVFSENFIIWVKKTDFDKAIRRKNYASAIDKLKTLVNESKMAEVRTHLTKMLSELPLEDVERILIEYIYDQED